MFCIQYTLQEKTAYCTRLTMKKKLITGIELSSYIQMLASDKQTCILRVQQHGWRGVLCMKNGDLLDAQTIKKNDSGYSSQYREKAVIEMLRWKQPEIEFLPLRKPIKKKIKKSLEFLLLESCRFQDENKRDELEEPLPSEEQQFPDNLPFDNMSTFVNNLQQNRSITAYLILDTQGNIVAKEDKEDILNANFVSFVRFTLNSYNSEILPDTAPSHSISFTLEDNKTIIIYSLQSNVLGLVVNSPAEVAEIEKQIPPLLSCLQTIKSNAVAPVSL